MFSIILVPSSRNKEFYFFVEMAQQKGKTDNEKSDFRASLGCFVV